MRRIRAALKGKGGQPHGRRLYSGVGPALRVAGRRERIIVAYVEVSKDGTVVARRAVPPDRARSGCEVCLEPGGRVRLQVGQSAVVGGYEVRVVDGPVGGPDSSDVPSHDGPVRIALDPPDASLAATQDLAVSDDAAAVSESQQLTVDAPAAQRGTLAMDGPQAATMAAGPDDPTATMTLGRAPTQYGDIPPQIEGYDITGALGRGGMGTVWKAVQLSTKREVALKFLGTGGFVSPAAQKRFEREVKIAARLEHPNIARVYESGLLRGGYYYAMELIHGTPLDAYVRDNDLPRRQMLELLRTVSQAVEHAHKNGVVHRDLKPSNILVTEDGQPHILDFGLARSTVDEDDEMMLSIDGQATGTPAFMAPEQAAGRRDDMGAWTDVYALGVIAFGLITGHTPHDLTGLKYDVIRRIAEEEVQRPRDVCKDVDKELEALLLKALASQAADRYPTAGALADDIRNYLQGRPLTARPITFGYVASKWLRRNWRRLAAAAVLAGIITATAVVTWYGGGGGEPVPMAEEELGAVVPVKAAAEVAWERVQGLDPANGFGEVIAKAQAVWRNAEMLFDKKSYAEAKKAYEELHSQAEAIWQRQQQRRPALDARDAYQQALKRHDVQQLGKYGGKAWEGVGAAVRTAESAGDDFAAAAEAWRQAEKLLGEAVAEVQRQLKALVDGYVAQAQSLYDQKKYPEALAQAAAAVAACPTDPTARAMRDRIEARLPLPRELLLDLGGGASMKLVLIPAGKFLMGSPADEPEREPDEGPQRTVTISRPFHLGATEVTQRQYERAIGTNPSRFLGPDNPVDSVSWNDAVAFCRAVADRVGRNVRLPTEAEWEYACRAGTTGPFYTGPTISTDQANYAGNYAYGEGKVGEFRKKTLPVGTFPPNPWGLYDLYGNVGEWCADWYGERYYEKTGDCADPKGPVAGDRRVLRGGPWSNPPAFCRSANRFSLRPDLSGEAYGLRVAVTVGAADD